VTGQVIVIAGGYRLATLDSSHFDAVDGLYARIWGQFGAETDVWEHAAVDGFAGVVALTRGGELAGYVYGITARPGQRWTERIAPLLAPEVVSRDLFGSFYVVELAVAQEHRQRGLGGQLMRAALGRVPHAATTIATEYDNAPARALYERLGYTYLLERISFYGGSYESVAMHRVLPLT
jgi:ribosomal protein S18 acetylase RimI-like enzyme